MSNVLNGSRSQVDCEIYGLYDNYILLKKKKYNNSLENQNHLGYRFFFLLFGVCSKILSILIGFFHYNAYSPQLI